MYSCGFHRLPKKLQKENRQNTPLKCCFIFFKIAIIQQLSYLKLCCCWNPWKVLIIFGKHEEVSKLAKLRVDRSEGCNKFEKRTNILILSKNRPSQFPQTWCPSCLETVWQSALSWPWNHDAGGSTLPSQWPSQFPRRPRKAWSTSMKRRLPLSGSCTA